MTRIQGRRLRWSKLMIDFTYEEKAQKAWGDVLPDWVEGLAKALDGLGSKRVGYKIGYNRTTLSKVINNNYPHNTYEIERGVRISLMEMSCPLLDGDVICDQDCENISLKPFNFSTCRICPNYRGKNYEN